MGTDIQVQRWVGRQLREERRKADEQAALRARITSDNEALAADAERLREVCAEYGVGVSIQRGFREDTELPTRHFILLALDDPAASSWLLGRLSRQAPAERVPTAEQWAEYGDQLEMLLGSLDWAGWSGADEECFVEYDDASGPVLDTTMRRSCMAFGVEFRPLAGKLVLTPYDDVGEEPPVFSMLDAEVVIELSGDVHEWATDVAQRAGEHGLLDATRVEVAPDLELSRGEFIAVLLADQVWGPAAAYRGLPLDELAEEIDQHPYFKMYFSAVAGMFGAGVLPDLVPSAAALGIAAWCWRNGTAVEDWHIPSDVLMARINIAVTKLVEGHIDPFAGVDWASIERSIADPGWSLPDGRRIANLFGEGWPEVRRTVGQRLGEWRGIDEDLIGPQAALRLLTIGGSTSYTDHWWGQGRWQAICRAVVEEAVAGGIGLPAPYDELGANRFIEDLAEPDKLPDEVLNWLIDMPDGGSTGPRGLRFHEASRPIVRVVP